MNIRLAGAAEAAILAALDAASAFSAHWDTAGWQGELAQPASQVWCAEVNGQIAGFIAFRGVDGQYEITNLVVDPGFRRGGIGLQLVQHALEKIASGDVTLEVHSQNVPAISLYEKAGFVRRGVRKQFYKDGADAQLMGKHL